MCALALCTGLMCQVAAGQNFVKVVQDSEILSGEAFCDSLLTRVEFPHAVSRLSNYPKINVAVLEAMQLLEDPNIEISRVYVCASTSPAGLWGDNIKLAQARADNVARYIQTALDLPESKIIKESLIEDWDRLEAMVEESDMPHKAEVIEIINTKTWGDRKTALRTLAGGSVWRTLEKDFFPELRSVRFGIFCRYKQQPVATVIDTVYIRDTIYIKEYIREEPKVIYKNQPVVKETRTRASKSQAQSPKAPKSRKSSTKSSGSQPVAAVDNGNTWKIGIKTNLLNDAIVIPNLGVELQVLDHVSFNLEGWYTPYNMFAPAKDTNFSGFRPQFRYWFGNNSLMRNGSFVAIDGALMWYTLKWRDGLLYQNGKEDRFDKKSSNSSPAWSAGVSYGYCFGLGKKKAWGIELELGIGYQRFTQNVGKFNEDTLRWEIYDYQEKQQFGITHANVSLTYRFSIRK